MRNRLSLVVFALLATTTLCIAQTEATTKARGKLSLSEEKMVANSRASWEAYKSRNIAAIKALTASDYVSYTQAGPSSLQQDIDTISKLTIDSYSIDEPKVSWVTKDVAILRYKCDLKGSYDGKPFKTVYATETWVNRGGKWWIVSYTETPVN